MSKVAVPERPGPAPAAAAPEQSPPSARTTRRQFLLMAAGAAVALATRGDSSAPTTSGAVAHYASRPDLAPPVVSVRTGARPHRNPVFLSPASGPSQYGPLILDNRGEPLWFRPVTGKIVHDFRVQQLHGRPVLTWWEGHVTNGYGQGEYVIADSTYRELRRFGALNGQRGDLHEFTLTPRGSALITIYAEVPANLSSVGGPTRGTLLEGVLQEIDLATDELLLEWHSHDHVAVDESYRPRNGALWDYFHINSIGVLPDANLLVSGRHTSTVYKIDRRSGEVLWRLGGKKSDFALGPGARFAFQHHARGHAGDLVSIFDDGAYSAASAIEPASRAILLGLDTSTMTAHLVRGDANPQGSLTTAMGSAQLLDDGGMFVGWGTVPSCSEFSADGELRFDAHLVGGGISYRAYREDWTGTPLDRPAIATERAGGGLRVFASWNGATAVTHWQILGGAAPGNLRPLRTAERSRFETAVPLARRPAFVAATALDSTGRALARSRTLPT